jgi:hypothetical protein
MGLGLGLGLGRSSRGRFTLWRLGLLLILSFRGVHVGL